MTLTVWNDSTDRGDEADTDDTDDEDESVQTDFVGEDHRRIAVDFDGTITTGDCRYWTGERPDPDERVCQWVREQYRDGHTIIVWTARPWREANRIAAHLVEWDVPYHGIRCNKGSADAYVDDKAVPEHVLDTDT